jgi:uncharacterized membrane protein YeaQ/YmgE (transglycosylase-associated protein family)
MVMSLLSWIVVGAIGGWLAGYILSRNTALNWMDVVLGMVGALVGGWLASLLLNFDIAAGISPMGIVAALVGSLIVAFAYEKMTGRAVQ